MWWPAITVFAFLRLVAVIGLRPLRYDDTASYEAGVSLFASERLWVVPTFFNLVPSDSGRVLVQTLIGITCWSLLAVAVARMLTDLRLQRIAACAVLLVGLTVKVTQWDLSLISESLAISFGALLIAALLEHVRAPTRWSLAGLVAAVVLWTFTRQSHVLLLVAIVAAVAASLAVPAGRRQRTIVLLPLVVIAVWGATSLPRSIQFTYNSLGIIGSRIYTDEEATAYFADRGMPTNPPSVALAGSFEGADSGLFEDRELVAWIDDEWPRHYATFLLSRPASTIRDPLEAAPSLLSSGTDFAMTRPVLPAPVADSLHGSRPGDLAFWWAVGGVLVLAALVHRPRPATYVAMGVTVAAGLLYLGTWHLSTTELPRLSVIPAVAIRLGLLLCIVDGIDATLQSRREGPSSDLAQP